MNTVNEAARDTPVIAEADVVVLGGGPAGIAAATAAARTGARTIMIERYGFLGGMGTIAMVTNFCGLHGVLDGEIFQLVHGIADDIVDRIDHFGGLNKVHTVLGGKVAAQAYDIAAYKLAADDLLLSSGVDIIFHCMAVGVVKEGDSIDALIVETKSGRGAIKASYFIDCSGDGDLAKFADAPWKMGDETGFMQFPTQMFRVGDVNNEIAMKEGKPNLSKLMKEAAASGEWKFSRSNGIVNPQKNPWEWRVNMTQIFGQDGGNLDCTNFRDLSYAEIEGRKQVDNIFRFIKSHVPGFEDSYLLEIAPQIGVRETRRVMGEYVLQAEDIISSKQFKDCIGVSAWPVERHVKGGVDWQWLEGRGYHDIPFGSLVPKEINNLFVAGRCASMSPVAQAAARVSGPCFAMGQAVGTAAALNLQTNTISSKTDITRLQNKLRSDGVYMGETPPRDAISNFTDN